MNWMQAIVEERIKESICKGEFDQLPGKGKPLELDDDSMVPEDLRASYRLMKNAGVIPEELQLSKELLQLEDLLACCTDQKERGRLQQELSVKRLRYQQLMSARGLHGNAVFREYEEKLERKLSGDG